MFLIQKVTANPLQKQRLVLEDGSIVSIELYYRDLQQGWFINELTWNSFTLRGMRICNHPNLLHQYKNQIPFGLACYSTANREPSLIKDFSSQASKLYILSSAECEEFLEYLKDVQV